MRHSQPPLTSPYLHSSPVRWNVTSGIPCRLRGSQTGHISQKPANPAHTSLKMQRPRNGPVIGWEAVHDVVPIDAGLTRYRFAAFRCSFRSVGHHEAQYGCIGGEARCLCHLEGSYVGSHHQEAAQAAWFSAENRACGRLSRDPRPRGGRPEREVHLRSGARNGRIPVWRTPGGGPRRQSRTMP